MKQVYYKGEAYEYEVVLQKGKKVFKLSKNGTLMHSVDQSELDIKSLVSLILEAYYRNSNSSTPSAVI
jgi:hypothetical protein